ncbi:unnamed protein product [Rhizoctonia solani]|uniref:Uncharacterized protein n=1 Tax=Rhizoctonia solani TaxID=456999 RepID=A0A8H2WRA6_9AGAM|nr:unnamed protein product [Rhizoctonia solani]
MQHMLDNPSTSVVNFPHVPFQFNATLGSPLFDISPVASDDTFGWTPSCLTPSCLPTASWSTRLVNSTLDFSYWGWGVAFEGTVEGNMTIQVTRDGRQEWWNSSKSTLFTIGASPLDQHYLRNVTLEIIEASPDARLTVSQVHINGSSFGDGLFDYDRWMLTGDNPTVKYTGFTQRPRPGSPTTHASTTTGDKVELSWNGSAVLLYGPCGPSNGLVRVGIDGFDRTLNLSRPFQSDDCLLFQSHGMSSHAYHRLEIENLDGGLLVLDRMEFIRVSNFRLPGPISTIGEMVLIMLAVLVMSAGVIVVYTAMTRRTAKRLFDDSLEPLLGDPLDTLI